MIHIRSRKIKIYCFTITIARLFKTRIFILIKKRFIIFLRFFKTRIFILIKKIFIVFFLIFLMIFICCEEFFLFIEVLFTTFNQLSSNFLLFIYDDEKIVKRRERFKHKYISLKIDIKNVSDNLQLIINEKFNWFRRFNNSLNELT